MFVNFFYSITLPILFVTFVCSLTASPIQRDVVEQKSISNFTLDGDFLYFGAGYHNCRINISTRDLEQIYTTQQIKVETPLLNNGIVYFGGTGYYNSKGKLADKDTFFAYDL